MVAVANKKTCFLAKGKQHIYTSLLNTSTPGTYSVTIPANHISRVVCVGGGGAAAMRGVYDDKGYGWGGGSGGAFEGLIDIPGGTYTVVVGSANNNTTAQSGNSQTLNPSDTSTHDSYISGVLRVGGGGSGHYNSSYVGAAGAAPTFTISPLKSVVNRAGNAGASGSGGKGSAAAAVVNGGGSVWGGYGKGQGCATSEYASKRYWINGSNGYVRIEVLPKETYNNPIRFHLPKKASYYTLTINPEQANAVVKINNQTTKSIVSRDGMPLNYSVSLSGWNTVSGTVYLRANRTINVNMKKTMPANPTWQQMAQQSGKNLNYAYTVTTEGYYRVYYDNYYSASDRHAYVYIDGVEKAHWNNRGYYYSAEWYLEKGQVITLKTNNVAFTVILTIQAVI